MSPEHVAHSSVFRPAVVGAVQDDQKIDVRLGMGVAACPRAEEHDLPQPIAVEPPQVACDIARDLASVEAALDSREYGIRPCGERAFGLLLRDERLVPQPLDDATLHARVVEGEPRGPQVGELAQRVLEPAERAPPGDRSLEQLTRLRVAHALREIREVRVALACVERVDASQVGRRLEVLIDVLAIPHPEAGHVDLAALWIEIPRGLAAMFFERVRDLRQVDALEIELLHLLHPARASILARGAPSAGGVWRRAPRKEGRTIGWRRRWRR